MSERREEPLQIPIGDERRRLSRLAQAVLTEGHDAAMCERCQDNLPLLAVVAMDGGSIARLYPEETAHLDRCEVCAAEFAALLDNLQQMEQAVGDPSSLPPASVALRIPLVVQLDEWLSALVLPLAEKFRMDDEQGVRATLKSYHQWRQQLPNLIAPGPKQQMALGFGNTVDQTLLLLLAGGFVTDNLLAQYSAAQIRELSATGQLSDIIEQTAKDIVQALDMNRSLRQDFVRGYIRHVQRDVAEFASLFVRPD